MRVRVKSAQLCPDAGILADVGVKHSAPLAPRPLHEEASDAEAQDALIALANAALEQNDTDGALRFVERVIAVNPSNPDSYLVKGAVAQQLGKNGDARSAYEHYLRLAPRGRYASDVRHILESL